VVENHAAKVALQETIQPISTHSGKKKKRRETAIGLMRGFGGLNDPLEEKGRRQIGMCLLKG